MSDKGKECRIYAEYLEEKLKATEAEIARRDEERNSLAEDNRMLSERVQRLVDANKSLTVKLAELKSENVTQNKKLTDYENELPRLQNYNRTCQTCRYLDESGECVLGNRCVNYALWQGRIL